MKTKILLTLTQNQNNMKRLFLVFTILFCITLANAQNPFEAYGYTPKIATLSNGKYNEFHDLDTIVQIGTVLFNTQTKQIVAFLQVDTLYSEATLQPDIVSMWMSPDPLSDERPSWSPYQYCINNPINRVDPTGALDNPIYDFDGNFLGTDDKGLQGEAIIMNKSDFKQGMSNPDAMAKGRTLDNMSDGQAMKFANNGNFENFLNHYNSLSNRPDWDGYLTLDEANEWYRTGNGKSLYTDLSKIDLSNLYSRGSKYVNQVKVVNLLTASRSLNDGLVYGQVTLKRYPNNQVRAFSDEYNFEMHNSWNPLNWPRNTQTLIGRSVAGEGQKYDINIYGSKTLKPLFPWTK